MNFGGVAAGGGVPMGALANQGAGVDVMSWYMDIPLISRLYLTGAFLTTAACAVDIISPFSLYFNWDLVFSQGQVWRLITSYLFFGAFSVDFLFHMYFLVRYSRMLEEGDFRGRTANYVLMLLFGIVCISLMAVFTRVLFLGSALTFMMVYVFGRRNPDVKMSFMGIFSFQAPWLPWVMLGFSILLGNGVIMDIIGIIVGHTYYYLEFVFPVIAEIRDWPIKRILVPPPPLVWLCGAFQDPLNVRIHDD
ncbi:Der1-like family protein [Nitzschia inconspicua]|uniref:Derlin n=1 Tax=Nitzschia inconspicua TaxID=303405 RepID=A0A9K3KTT4_9STRA|nr:Der1-like family protein [Nitzschia inconspicua]